MALSDFENAMPRSRVNAVLAHYDLPPIDGTEPGGGTASPKVILSTRAGRMLLKRRRQEFSLPEVVAYDHSLLQRLKANGLPVACPIPTRDGATAVFHEQWAFELTPFIEGLEACRPGDAAQVRAAGRMLARFHKATAGFTPAGRKDWRREFHSGVNAATLREAIAGWEASGVRGESLDVARRMQLLIDRTAEFLSDDRVDALPQTVCHGDYTSANILFRGSDVAGVFDLDWAVRESRLDDLARGLITFASRRRREMDAGSIWSLTQAFDMDMSLAREFISAAGEQKHYTAGERAALPWFVREVTLSMRIRAMRKVPDDRKISILTIDMPPLLTWLEQTADALAAPGSE